MRRLLGFPLVLLGSHLLVAWWVLALAMEPGSLADLPRWVLMAPALLVAALLSAWFSIVVSRFCAVTRRMAEGAEPPRPRHGGIWEFRQLASALADAMAAAGAQQRELFRRYVQLEGRTILLSRANRQISAQASELEVQQGELESANATLHQALKELRVRDGELSRAMASESAQAAAILSATADMVLVTDESGKVLLANPALAAFLGADAPLVGSRCRSTIVCRSAYGPPLCAARETCPLQAALSQGGAYREISLRDRGGEVADIGMHWSLVAAASEGAALRAVCVMRDITRQKRVDRAKSDFVAAVSHEMRSPLSSMRGFVHLLLRDDVSPTPEEARTYLGVMQDEIGRLSRLIDDNLSVARIEAGLPVTLRKVAVSLPRLLERAVAGCTGPSGRNRAELRCAPDLGVVCDEDKIVQVVTNLVANATKFSRPGGIVVVEGTQCPGGVRVSVSDAGAGIAPDDLGRLFERFYRGSGGALAAPGTGLGLHVAKGLVEAHGGTIWAESDGLGRGSKFTFELPMVAAETGSGRAVS